VPIGVFAIVVTLLKISESKDPANRRIDWIGFRQLLRVALLAWSSPWCGANDLGWGSTEM